MFFWDEAKRVSQLISEHTLSTPTALTPPFWKSPNFHPLPSCITQGLASAALTLRQIARTPPGATLAWRIKKEVNASIFILGQTV
jgi:hypothetical protein